MNTKEEVIQDAWQSIGVNILMGVCMNTGFVTCYCENGMDDILEYHNVTIDDLDVKTDGHGIVSYRPKQLQGLENNNGWITIESEADLPKDSSAYWVWRSDERVSSLNDYESDKSYFFPYLKATHYQPIEKPLPPIHK